MRSSSLQISASLCNLARSSAVSLALGLLHAGVGGGGLGGMRGR